MRDEELTQRPGRGWTPWTTGAPHGQIDAIWWEARQLHFPKLNVTVWFDGSEMVGLEHWGYRRSQWCMRKPPADHPPVPEEIVRLRQQAVEEALERFRAEKAAEPAAMAAQRAAEAQQRPPPPSAR